MADTNDTGAAAPEQTPLQLAADKWQDSMEFAIDGCNAIRDVFKAIKSLLKDESPRI